MIHSVLTKYKVPYYHDLNEEGKIRFQYRIRDYLKGRQFKSAVPGKAVEDEERILIASAAVALTFDVHKFWYPYFNLIIVHEGEYPDLIRKRYQKERVRMQGAIVINRNNLPLYSKNPSEYFHEGFHEFAHALYHENVKEKEGYLNLDEQEVHLLMEEESSKLDQFDLIPAWLSEFSQSTPQQFFASALLWKFSRPDEFKKRAPGLNDWLENLAYNTNSETIKFK